MPRRRGYRRSRRAVGRRRFRRFGKRMRKRTQTNVIKYGQPFPNRLFTTLTYGTYDNTGVAPIANSDDVYRGNSCYDPELAVGGHQPLFFDQLCAVNGPYTRYRVHGSAISVRVLSTNVAGTLTVFPSLISNPTISGAGQAWEIPRAVSKSVSESEGYQTTVKHKILTKQIFGDKTIQDEDYTAPYNADPTRQWYWHIVYNSYDNFATGTAHYAVKVKYFVEFYQLWIPGQS